VLVPRPETELLVEAALERLPARGADGGRARLLDLGTGSGAIAVSVALARPDAAVVATDVSTEALGIARGNARRLGAGVEFLHGDWWAALPAGTPAFDAIVSNPPYVAEADPHLLDPALRHEPRGALASGAAGLDAIAAIAAGAAARLAPGGWLLVEHGHDQGGAVRALLSGAGLADAATLRDLEGHERVGLARRAAAGPPSPP